MLVGIIARILHENPDLTNEEVYEIVLRYKGEVIVKNDVHDMIKNNF